MNVVKKIPQSIQVAGLDEFKAQIEEAILIRAVENKFLELFSLGELNGTVHTCVGQEFSAVAVAGQLNAEDWVTSNHRCHGHFISKTKNWMGLVDELMGLRTGVCMGVGSSQHLYAEGFISNGPQGALLPVASGMAMHFKKNKSNSIVVSYIGEGTLGEGVVYEAFNLDALHNLPHLVVCENNFYSQSTPQSEGVAGSITGRAEAFGIKTFKANTWELANLLKVAKSAIDYVRSGKPAFFVIETYRLNPHSKGDDNRDKNEIDKFKEFDLLNQLTKNSFFKNYAEVIEKNISDYVNNVKKSYLNINEYNLDKLPRKTTAKYIAFKNNKKRMVIALNEAYSTTLENGAYHIGEDIIDPYGGAFKVTKGFSTKYPGQVISMPISEAGLVGLGIGMAFMGDSVYAEIMFGDFMTNICDQVINNASKFYHMYGLKKSANIRIRTPMGGKRGYGPTHSQSIEKHFLGIDNVAVIALSSLIDPAYQIGIFREIDSPIIVIENKVDYSNFLFQNDDDFSLMLENKKLGSVRLSPLKAKPTLTVVSYGENARMFAEKMRYFFEETDHVPELIAVVLLHPLDTGAIERSLKKTRKLLIIEDGGIEFGFGAEVIAKIQEKGIQLELTVRVGAEPVPIASVGSIESELLTSVDGVIHKFMSKANA